MPVSAWLRASGFFRNLRRKRPPNCRTGRAPLGGSATVEGGGIFVAVSLTVRNSTVNGNTGDASGASGSAQGGGIFDVAFPFGPDGPPGGPLVLQNSNVKGNMLTGSAGIATEGRRPLP